MRAVCKNCVRNHNSAYEFERPKCSFFLISQSNRSTQKASFSPQSLQGLMGLPDWETEWQLLELSSIHGFPVWVREVHDILVKLRLLPTMPGASKLCAGSRA